MESTLAKDSRESARLAAVRRYSILDTPPDGAFDRIAAVAARALGAPMASVTIVDEDRIWFKAQQGLSDGTCEVAREPGLCASAILHDEPYVVDDAGDDPRTVGNTLVSEGGVRFYAAAPIVTADGYRLGTVNILDTSPRTVTEDELDTLRDLAGIVCDELELRLSSMRTLQLEKESNAAVERERARLAQLAGTLQRTLLPPALPQIPGLEAASHYRIASTDEVGGDFYDLFPLEGDRWGFFLGDVSGKGSQAAALTSLARHTLRAAAGYEADPVTVLHRLDSVLQHEQAGQTLEDPRYCTVLMGDLAPQDGNFTVRLAGGGHPPALVLRADGALEAFHPAGGQPVGMVTDPDFSAVTTDLVPGDTLLLYSDGLTEARLPSGAFLGENHLADLLAGLAPSGARDLVDALSDFLDGLGDRPADDVALLALGVPRPGAR